MIVAVDLYGVAAVIAAVGAVLTTLVGQLRNGRKIDAGAAAAKGAADLSAVVADQAVKKITEVHNEVASTNGATTGETIADMAHDVAAIAVAVADTQRSLSDHQADPNAHTRQQGG